MLASNADNQVKPSQAPLGMTKNKSYPNIGVASTSHPTQAPSDTNSFALGGHNPSRCAQAFITKNSTIQLIQNNPVHHDTTPPPPHAMCSQFHLETTCCEHKACGRAEGGLQGRWRGLPAWRSKVKQTPLPYRAYQPYMAKAGGNINISEETNWP